MKKPDRKTVLLAAAYDILKKAVETGAGIDEVTAKYDGADCDIGCLLEDIEIVFANELEMRGMTP